MIDRVSVRNFQSIRALDVDLGRFTVIVGASSSGKSAFIRALKAVASNVRGTSVLTRGSTTAAVTVVTDRHRVTLEHAGGAWRYRLTDDDPDTGEEVYTKLNGQVPAAITAALRINPVPSSGTSLNFAGQFDPPYLLSESGSTVARELGELTNVDTIYAAVREANRRRTAAANALKTREHDLDELKQQIPRFKGLNARLEAAERAQEALDRARTLESTVSRLTTALAAVETAEHVLARATLPPVPGLDPLTAAHERFLAFSRLVRQWQAAVTQERAMSGAVEAARQAEHDADRALHETLVAAGACPTCGQPVTA